MQIIEWKFYINSLEPGTAAENATEAMQLKFAYL